LNHDHSVKEAGLGAEHFISFHGIVSAQRSFPSSGLAALTYQDT
jgi:hypothetical protein